MVWPLVEEFTLDKVGTLVFLASNRCYYDLSCRGHIPTLHGLSMVSLGTPVVCAGCPGMLGYYITASSTSLTMSSTPPPPLPLWYTWWNPLFPPLWWWGWDIWFWCRGYHLGYHSLFHSHRESHTLLWGQCREERVQRRWHNHHCCRGIHNLYHHFILEGRFHHISHHNNNLERGVGHYNCKIQVEGYCDGKGNECGSWNH